MNHKSRTSQAGFSLVELMVVVAIIGVLAAIAVPQVNKYIAKARQSEAKTNLASIYTSEKAFFAEYNGYHSMFGVIGFAPEGKLRYNVGFQNAGAVAGAANGYNSPTPGAPGNAITSATYCGTGGTIVATVGCTVLNGADNSAPKGLTAGTVNTAGSTFSAQAIAVIYKSLTDTWLIDQNKNLQNTANGIN
ncbi:MAG: prepilin-type N-terminal cleavage/methylation domain-containing protein [Bdellovibrio sp.]|nr:prepilin-type N-terminal cleavage/methylation domain-containing protein [Bdellovibrio sp.]